MTDTPTTTAETPKLLAHHRDDLRKSGLSDETIHAAGLYSECESRKASSLLRLGYTRKDSAPCLVIPYPGTGDYARTKPDNPREDKRKDATAQQGVLSDDAPVKKSSTSRL